jgi:hypothetical protein
LSCDDPSGTAVRVCFKKSSTRVSTMPRRPRVRDDDDERENHDSSLTIMVLLLNTAIDRPTTTFENSPQIGAFDWV